MSNRNQDEINVLNGLIETTLDSSDGYKEAAGQAVNPDFKHLFERRALQRKQLTADLQAAVRSLGGEPEDDGTILAAAHRVFLDLKNKVSGSDTTVVDEVEAGEDHIKAKFEDAMVDRTLSAPVRDLVERIYSAVKAGHDEVRDIKHALHANAN